MAVGIYNKEGKLVFLDDPIGSMTSTKTSAEVGGKYIGIRSYGDGDRDVDYGAGYRRVYPNQQGEVLAIGNGFVVNNDVLSRGWYVIAPIATVLTEEFVGMWNGNGWVECGIPLASIALVAIARKLQLDHYFPEKLKV